MNYKRNQHQCFALALGLAMSWGICATSNAQEVEKTQANLKSYNFVEVQGGVQTTLTDAKLDKLITPVGAVSIGRFFTPVIGARLHVNGWQAKSGFSDLNGGTYYKWNYITTDADVMLNLSNLFSKKRTHFINVMLLGGIGVSNVWGNDEANEIAAANTQLNMPFVWSKNRLSHNIRAGIRFETNVAKPVGVSLEVNANSLDDRFNSKHNNQDDWMITAMLGVSVRFGTKFKKAPAPVSVQPVQNYDNSRNTEQAVAKPTVVEKPKPKPEPKPETLREEHIYQINKYDPSKASTELQAVADYMKRNPNAKVSITGYADKGTGSSSVNMKISQKRANAFKKALVEKYNVDSSRIVIDAKGDTVQPFSENDKNRCVIIIGPAE